MKSRYKPKDVDWSQYFTIAEPDAERQWQIFERLLFGPDGSVFDFNAVLDFACGHGRMAARFAKFARKLICCDINEESVEFCRRRFATWQGPCVFDFVLNTDTHVPLLDSSVTFVYSWDAMVHFEIDDLDCYLREFSRILKKGGCGLIHHSNYGSLEASGARAWNENPHWRATVSASDVRKLCERAGISVLQQELLDWTIPKLDCITILQKR